MQDLCPLCLRKGAKQRIKLFQINLEEAIWTCEGENCAWPFGNEDPVLFPRPVGKLWSYEWDDQYPTIPRKTETISSSLDQTISDLALISSKSISEKLVNKPFITVNQLNDTRTNVSSTVNETQSYLNKIDYTISTDKQDNKTNNNNNAKQCKKSNNNVQLAQNENNKDFELLSDNKNIKPDDEVNLQLHLPKKNLFLKEDKKLNLQKIQNTNNKRALPTVTSIDEINSNSSNIILDRTSVHEDICKTDSNSNEFKDATGQDKVLLTKNVKLVSNHLKESSQQVGEQTIKSNQGNNAATFETSNLNITTVEISGLPPITLCFEYPPCTAVSEVTEFNIAQPNSENYTTLNCSDKSVKPISSSSKSITGNIRRNVTSGKQYEKFSFNAIKKKKEFSDNCDTVNNRTDSLIKKPVPKNQSTKIGSTHIANAENVNGIHDQIAATINCRKKKSADVHFRNNGNKISVSCNTNSKQVPVKDVAANDGIPSIARNNLSSQSNIPLIDTSVENVNVNIDTVLDDFLICDSVSEDINDEWINALLS